MKSGFIANTALLDLRLNGCALADDRGYTLDLTLKRTHP